MIIRYIIDLWNWMNRQGFPCLFRRCTGLYCPGCGGTRALKFLLQGRLILSLYYNPLVLYIAAVAAGEWTLRIMAGKRGKEKAGERPYEMEVYVGIGIALLNWIVKNGVLLATGRYMIP